jgi:hypothetical protein
MSIELFVTTLIITVGTVALALTYLRSVTGAVMLELCGSEVGARFWLRSADVLAISGALILVLLFGVKPEMSNWLETLRLSVSLALGALFVTVLFIGNSIWRNIPRPGVEPRLLAEIPSTPESA